MTSLSSTPSQDNYRKALAERLSALELNATQVQSICDCALDEMLFGSYVSAYSERYDNDRYRRYRRAAQGQATDGELEVDDCAVISAGDDDGAYVMAWLWVPDDALPPEPGPTYAVWIAEPETRSRTWTWVHDQTFTCDDDPNGKGARASAHEYARCLRRTHPCAYVAVRPAGLAPLPIRDITPAPASAGE